MHTTGYSIRVQPVRCMHAQEMTYTVVLDMGGERSPADLNETLDRLRRREQLAAYLPGAVTATKAARGIVLGGDGCIESVTEATMLAIAMRDSLGMSGGITRLKPQDCNRAFALLLLPVGMGSHASLN